MIFYLSPNGTHAVFTSQKTPEEGYHGGYDVVQIEPGEFPGGQYPDGAFVGNRKTVEEAIEWANRCDRAPRMVPFRFSAKRTGFDTIEMHGWNEDGSGEGPTVALTNSSALGLVAEVATALNSEAPR